MLDADIARQAALELMGTTPGGQPEVQAGPHEVDHFPVVVNPAGKVERRLTGNKNRGGRLQDGIFSCQGQDLPAELMHAGLPGLVAERGCYPVQCLPVQCAA